MVKVYEIMKDTARKNMDVFAVFLPKILDAEYWVIFIIV